MGKLTRRDFLSTLTATAAAAYLPPALRKESGFEFVYFTDTHVAFERNVAECRGMLAKIRETTNPAFAINGGDVTEYGWAGEFDNYQKLIREFGVRTYDTAGNHDVRWSPQGVKIFRERLGEPYGYFQNQDCHFLILDSTVPLSHWGHYEKWQLRWLEYRLDRIGREEPVFITTHHWVGRDDLRVDNQEALRKLLEPYNVRLIFNGHGHNDLVWEWDGITNTMNRGLYQGSWERVQVDPDKDEVRLDRWRKETQVFESVAVVPLKATKANRPVWAISDRSIGTSGSIASPRPGIRQYRWNEGKWTAVADGLIAWENLHPGHQALSLRGRGRDETIDMTVVDRSSRLEPVWQRELPGGVMSHAVIDDHDLILSMMDGAVTCLSAATGGRRWQAKTTGYCHSSSTVFDDLVIVGSADASLYAFDRANGDLRWKFATEGPVYASAVVAKGVVVFGSGDGQFYGLDAKTGRQVWKRAMPASNTAFCQSRATSDGERVFLGAWDSHMYGLDAATGTTIWRQPCQERTFAFSPAISSPAYHAGRVYVAANGNGLFCFDAVTGERVWMVESPGEKYGHSSPRVIGDRLVVGCLGDLGEVRSVRLADGEVLWTASTKGVIYDSSPAIGDGFCAIGSVNGTLNVLATDSGAILAQYRLGTGHFLSTPAAQKDMIWAATYGNMAHAFRLKRS